MIFFGSRILALEPPCEPEIRAISVETKFSERLFHAGTETLGGRAWSSASHSGGSGGGFAVAARHDEVLEDAFDQAEWEFGVRRDEWKKTDRLYS